VGPRGAALAVEDTHKNLASGGCTYGDGTFEMLSRPLHWRLRLRFALFLIDQARPRQCCRRNSGPLMHGLLAAGVSRVDEQQAPWRDGQLSRGNIGGIRRPQAVSPHSTYVHPVPRPPDLHSIDPVPLPFPLPFPLPHDAWLIFTERLPP